MSRPTSEEAQYARQILQEYTHDEWVHLVGKNHAYALRTLLKATDPPTDEEIAEFAASEYRRLELGAESIRTKEHMLQYFNTPGSRVSAMYSAVRHFFGKPEGQ